MIQGLALLLLVWIHISVEGAMQVSSSCAIAIQDLTKASNITSSCNQLANVANSSYYYEDCTISNQGLDCQNLGEYLLN
jgi:hypothetical protein